MKLLTILFALLMTLSMGAVAAEATSQLSWVPPETRVDGSSMTVDEIAEYRVYYTVDGEVTKDGEFVTIGSDATSESITLELTPRAEAYTVIFAITVVDTDGRESQPSDPVSKVFNVDSTAAPNPPTSLTFTVVCGDGCTIEDVVQE